MVKNKIAPPFRKVEFDILYAQGISYTGDLIDAEEAWRIGMINKVHDAERLEEETLRYARRAAAISLEGLQTTKATISRGAEIAGFRSAAAAGFTQVAEPISPRARACSIRRRSGASPRQSWQLEFAFQSTLLSLAIT